MKKVLHYISGTYLTLTETWIYGQISNLKEYSPVVYCRNTNNLDIYPVEKIRSFRLKDERGGLWTLSCRACSRLFGFYPPYPFFLLKDRPDLIHAHFGMSGYNSLFAKKAFSLPLVTTFYGLDLGMFPYRFPEWKERYLKLFDTGDLFLLEGSHMRDCLIELGCPAKKALVQHLGIDLDKTCYRKRELDEDEKVKVLVVGSFREKKGIPYALEAFGMVARDNPEIKMELTIIGDSSGAPEEEKEKSKMLDIINKCRISESVKMLGYQPFDVLNRELYQHHIFLSPSVTASDRDTEGGAPVTIIEASASGMPVLSTLHCDIPEVVLNGESGYLVPEKDIESLAGRLDFLVKNPSVWEKMGAAGRQHIENEYDVKKQVGRLEEIYNGLLPERRG